MFGCFTANGRPDWDCFLIILSGKRHDIIAWVENLINDLIYIFKSITTQVLFVAFFRRSTFSRLSKILFLSKFFKVADTRMVT